MLLANAGLEAATASRPARDAARWARDALAGGALLKAEGSESLHPYRAAWTLALCDELDAADAALNAAAAHAGEHGSHLGAAVAACFRSAVLARRGALADADAAAAAALDAAEEGWRVGVPLAAAFRAGVLLDRGELAAAEALVETTAMAHAIPGSSGAQLARFTRGRVLIANGHLEDGLADLKRAVGEAPARNVRGAAVGAWHAEVAAVLARLGRAPEAERMARDGLERARDFGAPSVIGAALRTAAVVAGDERGSPLLAEAIATLRRSPARLELGRALVDLGALLRRRNRRAAARRELRTGLDLAERCGATPLARRAHAELQAAGSRPRRPLRKGVDALTASERRVASLAAQGRSNREIAEELVVTVKTVEWHLSQTYRKLDVRSRTALPAALGDGPAP